MIHNVLPTVGFRLNEFLRSEYALTDDRVIISGLVDLKGNPVGQIENKVVMTLLNIEEEKTIRNSNTVSMAGMPPPVHVNLYVLCSAYFPDANYTEALKFVSSVIHFFQGNPVFDRSNTPMLSENVDKVICEMVNVNMQELSQLWSSLGAKYLPSVIYKFRMLTFNAGMIREEVPVVLGRDTQPGKGIHRGHRHAPWSLFR